jgi:hypothetical protein
MGLRYSRRDGGAARWLGRASGRWLAWRRGRQRGVGESTSKTGLDHVLEFCVQAKTARRAVPSSPESDEWFIDHHAAAPAVHDLCGVL